MTRLLVPISQRDHIKGPASASLSLVQYGDLQCPHCALVYPVIEEISQELSDSLQVVFRHFPLAQMHPRAQEAAEALEAAGAQGKFWELLDLLYLNNEQLDFDGLCRFAKKVRLDLKRFTRELETRVHKDRVRADFLSGVRSGVAGTPTLFINGEKYTGGYDFDAIVAALLTASRKEAPSTSSR